MVHKYHKTCTISDWRRNGLILTSEDEGYEIYWRKQLSTHCEKCGNKYKSTKDKCMDHSHCIHDKYGYFRNILCNSCNLKRCKIHSNNTSGYNGIHKQIDKKSKLGYYWTFQVTIDGKRKTIKSSTDKEWLIKFAIKWKIDNNYDN